MQPRVTESAGTWMGRAAELGLELGRLLFQRGAPGAEAAGSVQGTGWCDFLGPELPPASQPRTLGPLCAWGLSSGLQSCFRTLRNYDFHLHWTDEHV